VDLRAKYQKLINEIFNEQDMPLDKIQDVEKYIQTHESLILHIKGNPVACIVEEMFENKIKYDSLEKKSEIKASLSGFLNKHEEIGLLMGFKLRIQVGEQIFEYTSYPTDEFIDTVIFNEKIFVIDGQMNQIISFKILTDQFVKTKSELDKFKKLLNK
jgi:hypothetical protein|tara:strand:+ start:83 stop:556 length:474 start_codon:yes stop_codon:yes gene_type:complete